MRFFKPESKEYISDFVPQDINAIYKMKQNLDADAEKTETAIAVSQNAFNLKPGEMTGPLANNLNKMYQGESQKIADNYYSGNIDESTARVQIAKLTNHFNNNPEVQTVQYDNELIPVASALKANPLFVDYGISEGKDPQTGNWKPVQKSMTRAELQEAYKTYFPGDGFKELTPVLNSIMPDVLEGNTTIEGYEEGKTTALGQGLYNVKTATGYKTVKLDEAKVRREIHDWVNANWERNNYEHYVYGRKRGDFQKPIDWENYIVNQFVGSRNDIGSTNATSINPAIKPGSNQEEDGNSLVPEGGIVSSPMENILGDDYNELKNSGFIDENSNINFEKLSEERKIFNINGKSYTDKDVIDNNIPDGYKMNTKSTTWGVDIVLIDPNGNTIEKTTETKTEKENKAIKMMSKMSKALGANRLKQIGVDSKNIVPSKDWSKIALAFNELSKTKGFGVQMTNASRDLINEKIAKYGLGDYLISVDNSPFESHQKLSKSSSSSLNGNKVVIRNRTSKKGKGNLLSGDILDANNQFVASINLRPTSINENAYFEAVQQVEDQSIDFMTTGNFKQFASKEDQVYSEKTLKEKWNREAVGYINTLSSAYGKSKGNSIMAALNIDPNNENDKNNILMLPRKTLLDGTVILPIVNANDPSSIIYGSLDGRIFNSIGELKVYADTKWYRTAAGLGTSTKDYQKTEGEK